MSKKIKQYFLDYPLKSIILFLFFMILIYKIPIIMMKIIIISLLLLIIYKAILTFFEEETENEDLQIIDLEECELDWEQYIDLFNEIMEEKIELNIDWIQEFNQIVSIIATDDVTRLFSDFDIAACLIYSLTLNNDSDENILFAFNLSKKIISKPKDYIRSFDCDYKFRLEVAHIFPVVDICIPDEVITAEAIVSIIRGYFIQKMEDGIVQLSDFLHILYLKCM